MITQIAKNLERMPDKASADAGYSSEANMINAAVEGVD